MNFLDPAIITVAQLISSTAPETEYAAYAPAKDYIVGERVIYDRAVWECVQTPNVGNAPGTNALYWSLVGPTNKWMMFDGEVNTRTIVNDSLAVVVAPGLVDSMALFGAIGATLQITGRDGLNGPVIYEKTVSLDSSEVGDWYEWTYQPFLPTTTVVLSDLPLYGSVHYTVTIAGSGDVGCGMLIFGRSELVGDAEYGLRIEVRESKRTGVAVKFLTATTISAAVDFDRVVRLSEKLRSKIIVLISTNAAGYESLNIFGKLQSFSSSPAGPNHFYSEISFEGSL